jgi:hypothetical protein
MSWEPLFPIVDGRLQCSNCMRCLSLSMFQRDRRRVRGVKAACRECELARCRDWYARNAQRERDAARNRMVLTPPEKRREYVKAWKDKLADGYVRQRLCYGTAIKPEDLPQSLIEAKRLELSIKRLVKEMEKPK